MNAWLRYIVVFILVLLAIYVGTLFAGFITPFFEGFGMIGQLFAFVVTAIIVGWLIVWLLKRFA